MTRSFAISILAITALTSPARGAPPTAPKLVVTIVIDQLSAWAFDERHGLLPKDGGFARLLREGSYVRELRYAHAITQTAPGHASLYTGAPPRDHGIVRNERLFLDGGKPRHVSSLADDSTREVTADGILDRPSISLRELHAESLADRLRSERPDARIIALSLKDRGAVFAAGHHPDVALWHDAVADTLATSTIYARSLPAWASTAFAAIRKMRGEGPWLPAIGKGVLPEPIVDERPGEGNLEGDGSKFPHRVDKPYCFRTSPLGDRLLLSLALAALDAEPKRGAPTLLAVSLSSHDYIAHVYGCDSLESYEELFAIDRALALFMDALDQRYGRDGWAMLVAADHGSTPLVEMPLASRPWCRPGAPADRWQRPCAPGHRVLPRTLGEALDKAAQAALGQPGLVLGVSDPYVYFGAAAADPTLRARLVPVVERALRATPGVAAVVDLATLPKVCPSLDDSSLLALVCRSTAPPSERVADLYVVLDPGSTFDVDSSHGKGGGHGTPYAFNRDVPMLVRAPGRAPAGTVVDEPIDFSAYARTAAALLGIGPPRSALPARDLLHR